MGAFLLRNSLAWVCVLICAAGCNPTKVEGKRLSFSLVDLDGNPVRDSDERFAGKVVLVDIWGTWCPPCIEQIPHLKALHDRYHDAGLEIVSVEFDMLLLGSEDERRSAMKEFVGEAGIEYLVVLGGDTAEVGRVFPTLRNFKGFPTAVYIGRDGLVGHIEMGYMETRRESIEERVASLIAERAP